MGPIGLIPHHGAAWAPEKRPERLRATYSTKNEDPAALGRAGEVAQHELGLDEAPVVLQRSGERAAALLGVQPGDEQARSRRTTGSPWRGTDRRHRLLGIQPSLVSVSVSAPAGSARGMDIIARDQCGRSFVTKRQQRDAAAITGPCPT